MGNSPMEEEKSQSEKDKEFFEMIPPGHFHNTSQNIQLPTPIFPPPNEVHVQQPPMMVFQEEPIKKASNLRGVNFEGNKLYNPYSVSLEKPRKMNPYSLTLDDRINPTSRSVKNEELEEMKNPTPSKSISSEEPPLEYRRTEREYIDDNPFFVDLTKEDDEQDSFIDFSRCIKKEDKGIEIIDLSSPIKTDRKVKNSGDLHLPNSFFDIPAEIDEEVKFDIDIPQFSMVNEKKNKENIRKKRSREVEKKKKTGEKTSVGVQFPDLKKSKKNPLIACFWDVENVNIYTLDENIWKRNSQLRKCKTLNEKNNFMLSKINSFLGKFGSSDLFNEYYDLTRRNYVPLHLIEKSKNHGIDIVNVPTWNSEGTIKESVDMKILIDIVFWSTEIMNREKKKDGFLATLVLISMDNDFTFLLNRLKMKGFKIILLVNEKKPIKIEMLSTAHEVYSIEKDVLC